MRKFLFIPALCGYVALLNAQVSVNSDGSPSHSSAMFEVKSNTKGFLPPRMSWPQIQAIQNPAAGLVVYDEGIKALRMFDGSTWIVLGARQSDLFDPPGNFSTTIGITYGFGFSTGTSISLTQDKKVYVAGVFTPALILGDDTLLSSSESQDMFFAAFDSSANYLWSKRIGGVTSSDYVRNIEVDAAGNIYICGNFSATVDFDPGPGTDNHESLGTAAFFAKYDSDGNLVWARHLPSGQAYAFSTVVDAAGNIFVCGHFNHSMDADPGVNVFTLTAPMSSQDVFFGKYDASGNFVWAKNIGSTSNDFAEDIILLNSTIVITGLFSGTVDFDPSGSVANLTSSGTSDYFFSRYDTAGNLLWTKAVGTPVAETSTRMLLASDPTGSIILGGEFSGTIDINPDAAVFNLTSAGGRDFFVAKYNSAGSFLSWGFGIGGTLNDALANFFVDDNRNLFITGAFNGTVDFNHAAGTFNLVSNGQTEVFLAKYNSLANFVFAKSLGGVGLESAGSIVTSRNGKLVFCTGSATAPFISFNGEKILASGMFLGRYEE